MLNTSIICWALLLCVLVICCVVLVIFGHPAWGGGFAVSGFLVFCVLTLYTGKTLPNDITVEGTQH